MDLPADADADADAREGIEGICPSYAISIRCGAATGASRGQADGSRCSEDALGERADMCRDSKRYSVRELERGQWNGKEGGGSGKTAATAGASGFGLTLANAYATFCLCNAGGVFGVWHVARGETNGSASARQATSLTAPGAAAAAAAMATKEQTTGWERERNQLPATCKSPVKHWANWPKLANNTEQSTARARFPLSLFFSISLSFSLEFT